MMKGTTRLRKEADDILNYALANRGEMSELAEGARLEIACTAKSGTEGSNPSLSAIFISQH